MTLKRLLSQLPNSGSWSYNGVCSVLQACSYAHILFKGVKCNSHHFSGGFTPWWFCARRYRLAGAVATVPAESKSRVSIPDIPSGREEEEENQRRRSSAKQSRNQIRSTGRRQNVRRLTGHLHMHNCMCTFTSILVSFFFLNCRAFCILDAGAESPHATLNVCEASARGCADGNIQSW